MNGVRNMIYKFKSISVCNEINVPKIASHFGIEKKFKWDEPLFLKDEQLSGVISFVENKMVYIYHFGSIVFVNFQPNEISDTIKYIKKIGIEDKKIPYEIKDEFTVQVNPNEQFSVNYNSIVMGKYNVYYMETIALILARSVSLERVENEMNVLFDDIEVIIDKLEQGQFKMSDKALSKISSKILRVRYNSVSYVEVLDKPDIAWKHEGVEDLFTQMSELFELGDRFEVVKNKTEILLDTVEMFTNLSHSTSSVKLEWIVIVLIAFEVIMGLINHFI